MGQLQRILYVEDEPDIQAIARVALEAVGGFVVNICGSGEQALREAEGFRPNLIMLDVMMPGMDGPATLKALRQQPALAAVPVVFITAKVQASEVAAYKDLGAVDVIPKPFDPMRLASQVGEIWTRCHD